MFLLCKFNKLQEHQEGSQPLLMWNLFSFSLRGCWQEKLAGIKSVKDYQTALLLFIRALGYTDLFFKNCVSFPHMPIFGRWQMRDCPLVSYRGGNHLGAFMFFSKINDSQQSGTDSVTIKKGGEDLGKDKRENKGHNFLLAVFLPIPICPYLSLPSVPLVNLQSIQI